MNDKQKYMVDDYVEVEKDDGRIDIHRVKFEPWQLGDGTWVIGLSGISGGYALDRVKGFACVSIVDESQLRKVE